MSTEFLFKSGYMIFPHGEKRLERLIPQGKFKEKQLEGVTL
jgi:hypothetical protein